MSGLSAAIRRQVGRVPSCRLGRVSAAHSERGDKLTPARRVKRAKEKKARKAKTIKQLDGLGRRHLLDVRIIMRNTVFVTGMKLPAPGDEVGLRSKGKVACSCSGNTDLTDKRILWPVWQDPATTLEREAVIGRTRDFHRLRPERRRGQGDRCPGRRGCSRRSTGNDSEGDLRHDALLRFVLERLEVRHDRLHRLT